MGKGHYYICVVKYGKLHILTKRKAWKLKMNAEFFTALELLEKSKGIPKEYMIEKVEAALISAFKKE